MDQQRFENITPLKARSTLNSDQMASSKECSDPLQGDEVVEPPSDTIVPVRKGVSNKSVEADSSESELSNKTQLPVMKHAPPRRKSLRKSVDSVKLSSTACPQNEEEQCLESESGVLKDSLIPNEEVLSNQENVKEDCSDGSLPDTLKADIQVREKLDSKMIRDGEVEDTMPSLKPSNCNDECTTEADSGNITTPDLNDLCSNNSDNKAVASDTSMRQVKRKTRSSSSAGLPHAATAQCIYIFHEC